MPIANLFEALVTISTLAMLGLNFVFLAEGSGEQDTAAAADALLVLVVVSVVLRLGVFQFPAVDRGLAVGFSHAGSFEEFLGADQCVQEFLV